MLLGGLATVLPPLGVSTPALFAACSVVCLLIEVALAAGPTGHPALLLAALAVFGSMTVLGFTMTGELYPPEPAGRANGALNVANLDAAFAGIAALQAVSLGWLLYSAPRGGWRKGLSALLLAASMPVWAGV